MSRVGNEMLSTMGPEPVLAGDKDAEADDLSYGRAESNLRQ